MAEKKVKSTSSLPSSGKKKKRKIVFPKAIYRSTQYSDEVLEHIDKVFKALKKKK